jgi:hypothetical protein
MSAYKSKSKLYMHCLQHIPRIGGIEMLTMALFGQFLYYLLVADMFFIGYYIGRQQ